MSTSPTFTRPDLATLVMGVAACAAIVVGALVAGGLLADSPTPVAAPVDRTDFVASFVADPSPTGVVHDIEITAAPSTQDFGRGPVEVWAFGAAVPGPALRVELGDSLRVTARNELPVPTAVHWHGVRVPNPMDGVPGVTQDPIAPGESFTYVFTPPDAGTYWYHSHHRGHEQLERGLYGSLVVDEPSAAVVYDRDLVWMIDDWLFDDSGRIDPEFESGDDIHHNGRWGDTTTVNGRVLPSFDARPGERIRLRLVNASTARIRQLDLGGLEAVVVAMDGLGVAEPFPADGVILAPGNRVDLHVSLPVDSSGLLTIADRFSGGEPVPLGRIDIGGDPVAPSPADVPRVDVPDWSAAVGWVPSATFELELVGEEVEEATGLAGDPVGTFRWTVNDRSSPDPGRHVASLGLAEKLRFVNYSEAFHPMHLHGQFFQVVARDDRPVSEGHHRDTVLVGPGEVVDVVVVPTDVGLWALHCHIQLHSEYGMMTLIEVLG